MMERWISPPAQPIGEAELWLIEAELHRLGVPTLMGHPLPLDPDQAARVLAATLRIMGGPGSGRYPKGSGKNPQSGAPLVYHSTSKELTEFRRPLDFGGAAGLGGIHFTTREDFGYGPIRYPVKLDVKNTLHVTSREMMGDYGYIRSRLTPEHDSVAIHWGDGSTEWVIFDPTRAKIIGEPEREPKALGEAELRTAIIRKVDGKFVLFTRDGKRRLGTHDTYAEAAAQEKAIEISKRRSRRAENGALDQSEPARAIFSPATVVWPAETSKSFSELLRDLGGPGSGPLHLVAEAHEPKFSVAFRYAFARGRQAVKKSQNLSTVAARATGAIADALDEVLPKMLHAVTADGGEVGADLVNRRFRAMSHAHATTQVNLPPDVAAQMAAFPIDEADLAEQGRVHDSHITVKYGVHGSPNDVREALAGETLAEATMGKTIVFEGVEDGTADAVVVEIHSDCLRRWNKKINESVDSIENSYEYKPHATIAYVKPGLGQKYAGDSMFEGTPLSFDRLVYSSKDDQVVSIPLVASTDLRAAKRDVWTTGFGMSFDSQNPSVIEWAKKHAAELIKQITDVTRERIREAVTGLQEDGDWDVAYDKILNAVGDETRADLIARHETMLAAGEGQRLAWEQAEDQGLLSGRERREWIITEDERVCPICAQLAGAIAPLHGGYPGGIDGPPAHVQCRCTEGIIG